MTTQPGIYEGPLPPSFAFGRCVLDVAYASFDSPDDADNLPEQRRPIRAALELTPNLTGAFGAAGTLYGPVGITLTTENGVFDFWAIDSTNSTVTPAGWSWKAALKVDGATWSRFEFTPDSTSTDPLNLLDAALLASAATPPAQVSLAEQITRVWDGQINGYQARTVAGAAAVAATTGTWALDLAADTTLTIDGTNGQTVVLDLVAAGHTLTVTDCTSGPWSSDGKIALHKSRNLWAGGSGAGGSSQVAVTPTAPTWHDDPDNGENTYTIPATTGVRYLVGGTVRAAGTYPATASTTVTVTAELTDTDRYYLSESAYTSWSHTFPAVSSTLIGALDLSTVADGTDVATLKLQPGNIPLTKSGAIVTLGGKMGINQVGVAGTNGTASFTFSPLTKMRFTTGFLLDAADSNVSVGATVNSHITAEIRNGALVLKLSGINGWTYAYELDPAGFSCPLSGTLALVVDKTGGTGVVASAYINGVERARIRSTNYSTANLTSTSYKCDGFNNKGSWATGTFKLESLA